MTTQTATPDAITKQAPAPAANHVPNPHWAEPADDATIERTVEALRAKGYDVHVADSREAARDLILGLLPEGAEVSQGASETLDELGVTKEIEGSGRFEAIRPKTRSIDRSDPVAVRGARKLGASPDVFLNSAHALTVDGRIVIASNTGSQLGPIAFGAGKVIFAIGTQKIVPDLEAAMQRIDEYSLPLEHLRMQKAYGVDSALNKILIVNREFRPGRFTVVLIRDVIGA